MTQDEKKRKRLITLGLGLTFTLLILAGAWLWIDRENVAWRADDAKFAKYRDLYADWDKSCPEGLTTNPEFRAGLALVQPDALLCRFQQVAAAEDWPDGALEHRLEKISLAAKLYIMTHDEGWLIYRPCAEPLPAQTPERYIYNIGEDLIPAYYRQGDLNQLPTHFITAKDNFFDCAISDDALQDRDYD